MSNPIQVLVGGVIIRQDAEGRYCLNDLHKAAGEEKRHQPSNWLSSQQTIDLIAEISIPGIQGIVSKQGVGTFVCKQLLVAYAAWISAKFHLNVLNVFIESKSAPPPQAAVDPMEVLNDPAAMRGLLLTYTEKVIALQEQVEELAPKADGFDRLINADGAISVTNAAKELQMPPKKLFGWMRENGWIYRRAGGRNNLAYQHRISAGHLIHKTSIVTREDGTEQAVDQVLVTTKGLARLAASFADPRVLEKG